MKLHRNAKTTPAMRALIIHRIRPDAWPPIQAAVAAGVSLRTAYKWLRRYRLGGRPALEDRSSRPHRSPRQTAPAQVAAIVTSRHARLTAWALAVRTPVPRSTVARILARVGLNRLTRLAPPAPVHRYEYPTAGAWVHLDIKPLARILRVGPRIHGDRRAIVKGAGWEYVHVAVDDYSRVADVEGLPNQSGRTAAAFGAAADHAALRRLRSRPDRPQTHGKAERFIQTMLREWAYVAAYTSSSRRTRALRPGLRYYNIVRPHTALGYLAPCSRFPRAAQ